jgi:predicted component of type VI protein secretion system
MASHDRLDVGPTDIGVRVTIYNEVDGTTTDLLFPQFPIRIGRNKLNDLVLNHGYVSQWHAVLGLSQTGQLSLVQVGSSNSVVVDDRRLTPNEELQLADQATVLIAPFTLYVQLMQLPGQTLSAAQQAQYSYDSVLSATGGGSGHARLREVSLLVLDRLAERFLGHRIEDPAELARFGGRLEQTLEMFLRSFVALQRGQRQFREALDIKVLADADSQVDRAKTMVDLAMILFSRGPEGVSSLEHSFKNIMIHQVALLNGLMAGVRTLLGKLSPRAIAKQVGAGRRAPNVKQLWEAYQRIHSDLAEEDNEAFETIFGSQFGKAYAMLVGDGSDQSLHTNRIPRPDRKR